VFFGGFSFEAKFHHVFLFVIFMFVNFVVTVRSVNRLIVRSYITVYLFRRVKQRSHVNGTITSKGYERVTFKSRTFISVDRGVDPFYDVTMILCLI